MMSKAVTATVSQTRRESWKNVRFIAISNNVDSALNDGSNEFVPFLNITNEWYVRVAHMPDR